LRRGIIDRPILGWEEVRFTHIEAGWQRDSDFDPILAKRELGRACQRPRQRAPPFIEPGALRRWASAHRDIERNAALLGHAYLVGAGQPLCFGAERQNAAGILWNGQPCQQCMVMLIDIVDDPRDQQPLGYRKA